MEGQPVVIREQQQVKSLFLQQSIKTAAEPDLVSYLSYLLCLTENPNLEKQDTFVEKLVTQVIKNVQVKISNIHVRYEDDVSIIIKLSYLGDVTQICVCKVGRKR